jgi:arylsulfatase A-like enzyme
MATILDAIDQAVPPTVEGRSLVPFLQGTPPAGWRTHVRYDMDWTDHLGRAERQQAGSDPLRFSAIRTESHRYVAFNSLEPLLYDLVEDPDESTNRADDPSLGDVRRRLAALLSEPTTA